MRIMFKVLERSIVHPLDNSNGKLKMKVELLLNIFARESQLYPSYINDEDVTHVTPRKT